MTTSRPSPRSTSALVGEWTPPSRYSKPPISTGEKYPGIAQDAATARPSEASGAPARPNVVRAPSVRRAAQIQSPSGHMSPRKGASASAEAVMSTNPAGSRVAAADDGRKAHGRRAVRAMSPTDGRRQPWRAWRASNGGISGPSRSNAARKAPSGESRLPVAEAIKS